MRLDTEANLQAEFYHECKLIGLPCSLEVITPAGRLDAVVLNAAKTQFLAIIEVKRDPVSFLGGYSTQIKRYKRLGVPVYGLSSHNDPAKLAATIKAKHFAFPGVPIEKISSQCLISQERAAEIKARRIHRLRFSGFNIKA